MSDDGNSTTRADGERARFFAVSSTPLAIVGLDGTLRDANPAWIALLGPVQAHASLVERIAPSDRAALARVMDGLRNGVGGELRLRFARDAGEPLSLACELSAEPGASSFYCAARVVAEPARDEQARVRAALVRTLDETHAFGLYMIDTVGERAGHVVYANAAVEQIWEMQDLPERARAGNLTHAEVLRHVEDVTVQPLSREACQAMEVSSGLDRPGQAVHGGPGAGGARPGRR